MKTASESPAAEQIEQARREIISAMYKADLPKRLEEMIESPTEYHRKAVTELVMDDRLCRDPKGIDFL